MSDDTRVHRETWFLLPLLANGRATAEERERAGNHLAVCAECREELAREHRLADALTEAVTVGPEPEAGLARLMERLDRADPAPPVPAAPARRPSRGGWRLAPALVGVLGVAELAVLALLLAGGLRLASPEAPAPALPVYRTLSDAPAAAAPAATHWRVVPAPTLRVAELNTLLAQHGLAIVQGPSEAGVYTLAPRVPAEAGPWPAAQAEALAARLRQTPGVLFAEVVGAVGP